MMKYIKPELEISKIENVNSIASLNEWLELAGTKDTSITTYFVASV